MSGQGWDHLNSCLNVLQQASTIFITKKHSTLGEKKSEESAENNEELNRKNKIVKILEGN